MYSGALSDDILHFILGFIMILVFVFNCPTISKVKSRLSCSRC